MDADSTAAMVWDLCAGLRRTERAAAMAELLDAVGEIFARRGLGTPSWVASARERVRTDAAGGGADAPDR
jgi:hypothetical protein